MKYIQIQTKMNQKVTIPVEAIVLEEDNEKCTVLVLGTNYQNLGYDGPLTYFISHEEHLKVLEILEAQY